MSKKGSTFFFGLNKYVSVTHVFTCIFKGIFKYIVFRSVALVIKKIMGYFRFFFHNPDFLRWDKLQGGGANAPQSARLGLS